jgi:hypothetical protein
VTGNRFSKEQYSLIRWLFGCGTNASSFKEKYDAQPAKQKRRLNRVAHRMWLTLVLRYQLYHHIRYASPSAIGTFEDADLPSLEIYLLFSCIDTLAQPPSYKAFPAWLKEQPEIEDLINVGRIEQLYRRYSKEYGVGSNIRRVFDELPQPTVEWLSGKVRIETANEESSAATPLLDRDEVVGHVCEYFYRIRRNLFTHWSVSHRTYVAEKYKQSDSALELLNMEPFTCWHLTPATWEYEIDGKPWRMYLGEGVDEATILRVVLQAIVLQRMKIDVTSAMVEAYFSGQLKQSALYHFYDEVMQNASVLHWWNEFEENGRGDLYLYLANAGIPPLSCLWSTILLERLVPDFKDEHALHQLIGKYVDAIEKLNTAIEQFDSLYPPKQDWDVRKKALGEFFESQTREVSFGFVMQMPSRNEIERILLIARNPCRS